MLRDRPTARALFALAAFTICAHAQEEESRAHALFQTHCASCHGALGDGKGWTELERPARSFAEGGFSFGNTPEAIFRTLTTGIPGSPMPSFEGALDESERRLLADHVISLGPPLPAKPSDAELVVADRPIFVRGLLPAIAEGLPQRL